jgi:glycosyltransferase involved in cell wall biosynthesis
VKRLLQVVLNAEGTIGGEQRHVLHLLDGLDRDLYSPSVVTWDIPAFCRELAARDVPCVPVSGTHIVDLELISHVARIIGKGRFDLVHTHGHRGGMIGRVAAIRAGAPELVWTCHLAENKADKNAALRWGYARLLRYLDGKTDATIAVSGILREWLAQKGIARDRIEVIENGIDCEVFRPLDRDDSLLRAFGLDPEVPVIVCVARLSEQKGVATLIDATAELLARGTPVQLLLVGAGPLESEIRERAHRSAARIVFARERSDVPEILALGDVAVVPSLWEGAFCFSMLEAMACGVPVVCSDIPMFTDVVTSGRDAEVFSAGDPRALASAIVRVLGSRDKGLAMGEEARRLVVERFSVDHMRMATNAVYERLMGRDRT